MVFSIGKTRLFLYNSIYMNRRRPRSDDVLFISALLALLLGVAFLMYTTGTVESASRAWPFLVMAAGGFLLYLALVRNSSFSVLMVGLVLVLEGALILASILLGWELKRAWPFGMALVGLSGIAASVVRRRRMKISFAVPSIGFVALGLVFSAFSFGFVGISFKHFIVVWWPTLLIVGGISLFVAYGLSRGRPTRRRDQPPSGRPRRGHGPTSNS